MCVGGGQHFEEQAFVLVDEFEQQRQFSFLVFAQIATCPVKIIVCVGVDWKTSVGEKIAFVFVVNVREVGRIHNMEDAGTLLFGIFEFFVACFLGFQDGRVASGVIFLRRLGDRERGGGGGVRGDQCNGGRCFFAHVCIQYERDLVTV